MRLTTGNGAASNMASDRGSVSLCVYLRVGHAELGSAYRVAAHAHFQQHRFAMSDDRKNVCAFEEHFATLVKQRALETTVAQLRVLALDDFDAAAAVLTSKIYATPKEMHAALKQFHKTLIDALKESDAQLNAQMVL